MTETTDYKMICAQERTFSEKMDKQTEEMKRTNSLLATMVRQNAPAELDWLMLEEYAHEGIFSDLYSWGDKFVDTWKDVVASQDYSFPWRFNHLGAYSLADGETINNRPCLQLAYAHKFGVQFSHQRAIHAVSYKVTTALTSSQKYYFVYEGQYLNFTAPSGGVPIGCWLGYRGNLIDIYSPIGNLQKSVSASLSSSPSGTSLGNAPTLPAQEYYFTLQSSWGSNAVAGAVVSFTLGTALKFGEKIAGCYYMADESKSNWKIYTYAKDGITKIENGLATGDSTAGVNLGVLGFSKALSDGEYLLRNMQEVGYGYGRYSYSAVRQYLNSAAPLGAWWKPCDMFDIAPDQLSTIAGFLSGCSESFIQVIKPVGVKTYLNTTQDSEIGESETVYDKVFLPSLEEMYITPQKAGEGDVHEYWKRASGRTEPFAWYTSYPELIHYAVENHTSAQAVRLRSAHRGYSSYTWIVYSTGIVNSYYAGTSNRFAPLVVL